MLTVDPAWHPTTLPILYSFRRCPYAMRARLALVASGVCVELREVRLGDKPVALLAASPKGTVPVLVLPDGAVIDESLAIMRWAFAVGDGAGWCDPDASGLIATNDGAFKHHLDRYKYPERHGNDPQAHRDAAATILRRLDERLGTTANLLGDAPALVDLALYPFVRQYAAVDRGWFDAQPLGAVQAWLASHLASPLFAAIMVRPAFWRPGDAPLRFGA